MVKNHKDNKTETCRQFMDNSYRLAARDLLFVLSSIQDITYHGHCYSRCGALVGTRNSSMGPPGTGDDCRVLWFVFRALYNLGIMASFDYLGLSVTLRFHFSPY